MLARAQKWTSKQPQLALHQPRSRNAPDRVPGLRPNPHPKPRRTGRGVLATKLNSSKPNLFSRAPARIPRSQLAMPECLQPTGRRLLLSSIPGRSAARSTTVRWAAVFVINADRSTAVSSVGRTTLGTAITERLRSARRRSSLLLAANLAWLLPPMKLVFLPSVS